MRIAAILAVTALVVAGLAMLLSLTDGDGDGDQLSLSAEASEAMMTRLDGIEQRQVAMESLLRELSAAKPRSPIAAPESSESDSAVVPDFDQSDEIASRIRILEKAILSLEEGVREQVWFDPPPTIEQFRSGKEVTDWKVVEQVFLDSGGDRNRLVELVRGMTYEEILGWFGPPTVLKHEGSWWYEKQHGHGDRTEPRVLMLFFVGGYVTSAGSSTW